jgi:hypothetical protein
MVMRNEGGKIKIEEEVKSLIDKLEPQACSR